MRHLIKEWRNVTKKLQGKFLYIFLDYDGTLANISPTPGQAVMPLRLKEILRELSANQRCKVAVISGRSLADVKRKVGLKRIIYSGNHGLEISGPGIAFKAPVSTEYKNVLRGIKRALSINAAGIKGAVIEDKGLSLTLHFRLVDKKYIRRLKDIFRDAVLPYMRSGRLSVKPGKMCLEARPALKWDKGKVVLKLLADWRAAMPGRKVLPVYAGDDLTDEDAFKALKGKGITVFVGASGRTSAGYYARDPGEIGEFLAKVIDNLKGGKT